MTNKIIIISFLLFANPAFAATYYINPSTGNDSNDGSSGSPWLTFQKGCDTAVAGDTVILRNGTYTAASTVCETNSGSVGNVITFQAENQYAAVFDSSETVSGWSNSGESANIYHSNATTTIGSTFKALWRVGDLTSYNEETDPTDLGTGEFYWDSANTRFKIFYSGDPTTSTWKAFESGNDPITIRDISNITIDGITCQYARHCINTGFAGNSNSGRTDNITIKNSKVQYVTERGINIASSTANPSDNVIIENNIIQYIDASTESYSANGHCIKLASNIVGEHGTNPIIRNNTITNCYAHGIQCSNGWKGCKARNNTITEVSIGDTIGDGNGGIRFGGDCSDCDYEASGNTITGSHSTGIYVANSAGGINIFKNIVYTAIYGVYLNGAGSDIYIYNNIFRDGTSAGVKGAFVTGSIYVYGNTFQGWTSGGAIFSDEGTFVIKNNVCHLTNKKCISLEPAVTWTEDYNILYRSDGSDFITVNGTSYSSLATYQAATSQGAHSLTSDPLFTNLASNIFTLQAGSPGIGVGVDLSSVYTDDYASTARTLPYNMGAYETTDGGSLPSVTGSSTWAGGTLDGGTF